MDPVQRIEAAIAAQDWTAAQAAIREARQALGPDWTPSRPVDIFTDERRTELGAPYWCSPLADAVAHGHQGAARVLLDLYLLERTNGFRAACARALEEGR